MKEPYTLQLAPCDLANWEQAAKSVNLPMEAFIANAVNAECKRLKRAQRSQQRKGR